MKKILFFSNHLRGPLGEAGARSWHQVKALQELFTVEVVLPAVDPVTNKKVTPETYSGLNEDRVKVSLASGARNDRGNKFRRIWFYTTTAFNQLRLGMKVKHPDVIYTMSLPLTMLLVAWIVAKVRRVKLFVDVRDIPFDVAEEVGYLKRGMFLTVLKRLDGFLLRKGEVVFTVSLRFKKFLVNKGVADSKIVYAPIGFDNFPPPAANTVRKWRVKIESLFDDNKPEFLILYAGTFGHVVEVDLMLDVAELLKSHRKIGFVFVGDGQRLGEYMQRAECQSINAVFLGRVNKSDVHAICQCVDACLYASGCGEAINAMLGNKIFDYLGAGRAVIYAGPDSSVTDLLRELDTGEVLVGGTAESVAKSILSLTTDKGKRKRYELNAKRLMEYGYSAKSSSAIIAQKIDETL